MNDAETQGYVDGLERHLASSRNDALRVQTFISHIMDAPTARAAVQTFLRHRSWCRSEELFRRYSEVMQALRAAHGMGEHVDAESTLDGEDLCALKKMPNWVTVYTVLPDAAFEWTTSWDDALNWGLATKAPYIRKGKVEKSTILAIKGYDNPLIFVEPWHVENSEYDVTSLAAARRTQDAVVEHRKTLWWKLLSRYLFR